MALQIDSSFDNYTYPPLTDADYMISSRNASRRLSRRGSRSPMTLSSVSAFGETGEQKEDRLMVDPRRFTPTLHASLVSEILALRREVESKNELVLNLEEHMVKVGNENTSLHDLVSANSQEKKILKRQLNDLESSTLVAVEEIAKERDRLNEILTDTKTKLELSQKKARSREAEKEQIQTGRQQNQEKWDAERKTLELKVHVVESRLKTVLAEVAAHTAVQHGKHVDNVYAWSRDRPSSRASGRHSPISIRRNSFSNGASVGSKTLADELSSQAGSDMESEDCTSPGALPEETDLLPRCSTSQSNRQSIKARKLLGLHIDTVEERSALRDSLLTEHAFVMTEDPSYQPMALYSDGATQYSPPPSPQMTPEQRLSTITEFDGDSILDEARARPSSTVMTSSACQTIEVPPSPPHTPLQSRSETGDIPKIELVTASTQTLDNPSTTTTHLHEEHFATDINPTISDNDEAIVISKDAFAQVNLLTETTSTAVQTESIRTDERITKLPIHLHPAIIHPISPAPSLAPSSAPSPVFTAQTENKNDGITPASSSPQIRPQSSERKEPTSRSSIYQPREQSGLLRSDDELSDDSFMNRKLVKKSLSKVKDSWQVVSLPSDNQKSTVDLGETAPKLPALKFENLSLDQIDLPQQKLKKASGERNTGVDIDSNEHKRTNRVIKPNISRARSPSEPARFTPSERGETDSISGLPFPVPDRSSSRKFLWLAEDMFDTPTRGSSAYSRTSRAATKRPVVRKSRSYMSSQGTKSRRSLSPQALDILTNSLNDIPPPLPNDVITSPVSTGFGQESYPATPTQPFSPTAESARSDQATVVDAIAQTMIGEWMYKYVRRRKSFGIPDEPGTGENSVNGGARHQRWVWIAPYERAVLWSNKQPTSETALMGRNGKKLIISSVLDVQDDSPMPKGASATTRFGRSILILTPQRALKFTATSIERHHVWMNALSFLAQDPANLAESNPRPPKQTESMQQERLRTNQAHATDASLHRSPITNSIRIAKGKKRFSSRGKFATPLAEVSPSQEMTHPRVSGGAEAPIVPRCSADIRSFLNGTTQGQPYSVRSYTNATGPSLRYLHNNRGVGSKAESPRHLLRFWGGKSQRNSTNGNSYKHNSRTLTSHSAHVEQENLFEAVGTMRMSAFVQDTSERYIGNQRLSKSRTSLANSGSMSTSTLDLRSIGRGKSTEKLSARRKQSRRRMTENDSVPELPNISLRNSEHDPFEGF